MLSIDPPQPLFFTFLFASLALAITPGPGVFYIVTRSLTQGRRAGLVSVVGIGLGNLGNACAASLGLAAIFALSTAVFTLVKYAGALYLIYLGIGMIRSSGAEPSAAALQRASSRTIFRDGFFVALFNPKTTLFFAAFLPQFLGPGTTVGTSMTLGGLFVVIAMVTDSIYALAAGSISARFSTVRGPRRIGRFLGGSVLIGLGLFAALAGSGESR